jgi:hypothetical protein
MMATAPPESNEDLTRVLTRLSAAIRKAKGGDE